MGEYRIAYDGKLHRYKNKLRGDRGVMWEAESRALRIVSNLLRLGHSGIKYIEHITSEDPVRNGFISITWDK